MKREDYTRELSFFLIAALNKCVSLSWRGERGKIRRIYAIPDIKMRWDIHMRYLNVLLTLLTAVHIAARYHCTCLRRYNKLFSFLAYIVGGAFDSFSCHHHVSPGLCGMPSSKFSTMSFSINFPTGGHCSSNETRAKGGLFSKIAEKLRVPVHLPFRRTIGKVKLKIITNTIGI